MLICPKCAAPLTRTKGSQGVFWWCPSCDGRSATVALLRRDIPAPVVNDLWQSARLGTCPRKRVCPACGNRMAEVPAGADDGGIRFLDVCVVCQFVWFDPNEYTALPRIPQKPAIEETLPQEAREKLALLEIELIRDRAGDDAHAAQAPDTWWQWIPGILGMPIEHDAESAGSLPWVTWGLVAVVTAVSVNAFSELQSVADRFGLVPAYAMRDGGLTFLTSFLLHGGVFHLLGNMYFLLTFGDNVEDILGKWRYLLLVVSATVAGGIAHVLGTPESTVPCIGASGGISGVVAFYALKFPKAKLGILVRMYFYFRWVRIPAYMMFALWIAMQLFGTWAQLSGFSNVSSLAHLGGASVGVAFWFATRIRRDDHLDARETRLPGTGRQVARVTGKSRHDA